MGATTWSKAWASFSSTGPTPDGFFFFFLQFSRRIYLFFLGRIKPDVTTIGSSVFSAVSSGGYANRQGTSFSAPIVAGAVALVLQVWSKKNKYKEMKNPFSDLS